MEDKGRELTNFIVLSGADTTRWMISKLVQTKNNCELKIYK